jgi:hypothetical protein
MDMEEVGRALTLQEGGDHPRWLVVDCRLKVLAGGQQLHAWHPTFSLHQVVSSPVLAREASCHISAAIEDMIVFFIFCLGFLL